MDWIKKPFGEKKSSKKITEAVEGRTGMTLVQSLPEQSNVVYRGNLNSGNSVADQNENPGLHVKSFPEQNDIQPERESGANESATRGRKGRRTQEPAPKSFEVVKAGGLTISEPSTRITRSQAEILSEASKTSAKAEKAADVSEPSTSCAKVAKRIAKVGVKISETSKNSAAAEKGKAEVVTDSESKKRRTNAATTAGKEKAKGVTILEPKTTTNAEKAVDVSENSTKVEKGKAKAGVAIFEPLKSSAAEKGKAQEVGKGKKVETSERKTTAPIQKPSATSEKGTAQDANHVNYIRFEGFREEESRTPSQECLLCGRDLSSPAPGEHRVQEDDEYFVQMNLPDVSFLSCGHVFHSQCLDRITAKDQLTNPDPPCFFCST